MAALFLAATSLALLASSPSARAAESPQAPAQITTGSLDWGVKASFRRYVGEVGITVSGGVTRTADATAEYPVPGFTWPLVSGTFDPETKATALQFAGSVHFLAHEGALDMTIAEPKLVLSGAESTLWAEVKSRPFSGGEIVDYGVIPVVSLDLSGKEPTVGETTTAWPALSSYLTSEAGPAFAGFYPVATELDPVSTTYEGPGGKAPVTAETWNSPGSVTYEKALVNSSVHPTSVYPDLAHGTIDVAEQGGEIRALDPETLQPLGAAATVTRQENITNSHSAYDPVHGALFVVVGASVHELIWDAGTSSFTDTVLPGADLVNDYNGDLAYNAAAEELVHYNGSTMETWTRDGESWTRVDYELGGSSYLPRIAVDDEGDVLVATADNPPQEVIPFEEGEEHFAEERTLSGNYADPQAVQPGQFDQPTQVQIGPDGTAYLASYTGRVWTATKGDDDGYHQVGASISQNIGNVFDSTIDPVDGTFLLSAQGANRVLAYRNGAVAGSTLIPTLGFPNNFPYPYMGIAADTDHNLYAGSSDGAEGGLWKLRRVGLTPTMTTEPQDATVTLGFGEASVPVTFAAAAEGTPEPTLQWQSRAGASDRWTDLAGETGPTLQLTATVERSGLQVRAVATNAAGALASEPATLDVQAPPAIVVQPESQTTVAGTPVSFSVAPSGNPVPEVQWQRLDPSGFWVPVEDATSAVLTLEDPSAAMSGTTLRARLRNTYGTVYTRPVTLTVEALAAGPVGVTGGYLDWGVKESFRAYVRGPIAQGDYTAGDGAGENADGTLRFPAVGGSYDAATGATSVRLVGSVHFTGHAGALDMTLSALHVVFDGNGGGTLYADVVSKPDEANAQAITYTGVALASLDETVATVRRTEGTSTWTGVGATLTAAGAPAFAGFYQAGQALDPAGLAISVGGPVNDGPVSAGPGGTDEAAPTPAQGATSTSPLATTTAPKATRAPALHTVPGAIHVAGGHAVTVATVRCVEGPCKVVAPKAIRVRLGGKASLISVLAPSSLKSGKSGRVRLRTSAATARRLRGRATTLAIRIRLVAADGHRETLTLHPKLRFVAAK